jgi:hypothetical protein
MAPVPGAPLLTSTISAALAPSACEYQPIFLSSVTQAFTTKVNLEARSAVGKAFVLGPLLTLSRGEGPLPIPSLFARRQRHCSRGSSATSRRGSSDQGSTVVLNGHGGARARTVARPLGEAPWPRAPRREKRLHARHTVDNPRCGPVMYVDACARGAVALRSAPTRAAISRDDSLEGGKRTKTGSPVQAE